MSSGPKFDLNAYMISDKKGINTLDDFCFISAALVPKTSLSKVDLQLGSFAFAGKTGEVTGDLVWGVPPLESAESIQLRDSGDLQKHGILRPITRSSSSSSMHCMSLPRSTPRRAIVDTTNLMAGYYIHFDLCNEKGVQCGSDIDIESFAPFSHDAQSNGHKVSEPSTMLLLGAGPIGLGVFRRKI